MIIDITKPQADNKFENFRGYLFKKDILNCINFDKLIPFPYNVFSHLLESYNNKIQKAVHNNMYDIFEENIDINTISNQIGSMFKTIILNDGLHHEFYESGSVERGIKLLAFTNNIDVDLYDHLTNLENYITHQYVNANTFEIKEMHGIVPIKQRFSLSNEFSSNGINYSLLINAGIQILNSSSILDKKIIHSNLMVKPEFRKYIINRIVIDNYMPIDVEAFEYWYNDEFYNTTKSSTYKNKFRELLNNVENLGIRTRCLPLTELNNFWHNDENVIANLGLNEIVNKVKTIKELVKTTPYL